MNHNFKISAAPHLRSKMTVGSIMLYVIIALLPTTIFGIYTFGVLALKVLAITVGTAVLTEYLFQKILRKKVTIGDFHSVLTGMLLALNLPPTTPWWICVLGGMIAVLIMKPTKILNAVLATKCLLLVLFATHITKFVFEGERVVTPLQQMGAGESVDLLSMFLGNTAGAIGATSIVAILIGAAFLIVMEIIDVRIPISYLFGFIAFIMIFSDRGLDVQYLVAQLCGGTLMLGVWFMATDYMTSPITKTGKVLYGFIVGITTGFLRVFMGMTDGVAFAILFGNILVPLLERITKIRCLEN